jgi:hypothetical protein
MTVAEDSVEQKQLQKILQASRQDIIDALYSVKAIMARDFSTVIKLALMAEETASAEGKSSFKSVLQKHLEECEFNTAAKHLYAALIEYFSSGDVVLYDKYRRLQSTHVQLETSRRATESFRAWTSFGSETSEAGYKPASSSRMSTTSWHM